MEQLWAIIQAQVAARDAMFETDYSWTLGTFFES